MSKDSHKKHILRLKFVAMLALAFAVFALTIAATGYYLSDKVINVNFLNEKIVLASQDEAFNKISKYKIQNTLEIKVGSQTYELEPSTFNLTIDADSTVKNAILLSRDLNIFKVKKIEPILKYDSKLLEEKASLIAGQFYEAPQFPNIEFVSNSLTISEGKMGKKINTNLAIQKILDAIRKGENSINLTIDSTGVVLNTRDVENIKADFEKLKDKQLVFVFDKFKKQFNTEGLIKLLYDYDGTELGYFENVLTSLKEIETEAKNPVFKEENGKVKEFSPAINGIEIDKTKLKSLVLSSIDELKTSLDYKEITIPVKVSEPEIKTGDVNKYGINELISVGSSSFRGSPTSRIHNVELAASKISGTLIAPGKEFSFNEVIGDISVLTGFKQSYIIKDGQTMLGDGGGVCQVSTTVFRAALNAGLEIVERSPHSYRVSYYEQGFSPGIDATIYSPVVDLVFRNNTENYILMQAKTDTKKLTLDFEFYGTKDERVVEVGKPVISSSIAPPDDLYVDDPTKPVGYLEQVEHKAWGAKVYFDYKVSKNGEVLQEKRFYSNYQPWQAKFIRGIAQ